MATVVAFSGSDRLEVVDDTGARYRVQYIGVRGPMDASLLNVEASTLAGPLVMGKRVRLEAAGQDRAVGYLLRHVYLNGEAIPLAATMVAEGWARVVPYPAEHRFRTLYLQLQEHALLRQSGLWRTDTLGPVVPWRQSSSDATYIAADERLHQPIDLLRTTPTGREIVTRLERLGPSLRVMKMAPAIFAYAEPLGFTGAVSSAIVGADPRAIASILAHEGTHLTDMAANASGLTNFSCFELEIRSHALGAQVWAEFYGPGGKPNPGGPLDESLNRTLQFKNRGDIENYVRLSTGYQLQCARDGH